MVLNETLARMGDTYTALRTARTAVRSAGTHARYSAETQAALVAAEAAIDDALRHLDSLDVQVRDQIQPLLEQRPALQHDDLMSRIEEITARLDQVEQQLKR